MASLDKAKAESADAPMTLPWWRANALALGLLIVGLVLAFWPTMAHLAGVWWSSSTYQHGMFVPAIVGYMLWRRRHALAVTRPQAAPIGLVGVVLGCALWAAGYVVDANVVQHFAVVVVFHAAVLSIWGWEVYRTAFFPLAVLLLAVPFGDFAIRPLQSLTADWSVVLVAATGIPVYLEGWEIAIPGALFKVAEVCAGLRFVVAGVVLGVLVSDLFGHRWPHRLLFLLLCVAIPVLGNVLRAFFIIWLAHVTDLKLAMGFDHLIYGWIFFGFLSVFLIYIGFLLRTKQGNALSYRNAPSWHALRFGQWGSLVATLAMVSATGALAHVQAGRTVTALDVPDTAPVAAGDWQVGAQAQDWRPRYPGASETRMWRYTLRGNAVDLYVAFFDAEHPDIDIVSSRNASAGEWDISGTLPAIRGGPLGELPVTTARRGAQRRLIARTHWVDGTPAADPRWVKLLRAKVRVLGGSPLAAVVAVSKPYDDQPEAARESLEAFVQGLGLAEFLETAAQPNLSRPAARGG